MAIVGCGLGASGIVRSLKEAGHNTVGLDSDPLAPALYLCDEKKCIPQAYSKVFLEKLVSACREAHAEVILPLWDEAVLILSKKRDVLEESGIKYVLPSSDLVEMVIDKHRVYERLSREGLPVVEYTLISDEVVLEGFINRVGLPVVFKRRRGCGGQGLAKATSLEEVKREFRRDPTRIACEYLPGREYEVELVYDKAMRLITANPRRKLEYNLELGLTLKSVTIHDPNLCGTSERVVEALGGWVGPCSVEFKEDYDHNPKVLEVNPRFVSPTYLLTGAGVNIPDIVVRLALDEEVPSLPKYHSARVGVYLTRYLEDIIVKDVPSPP